MIDVVKRQIQKGEILLWHGKPDQKSLLNSADRILIPVSILWLLPMIVFEYLSIADYIVLKNPVKLFDFIFGVPLVIAGLYFTAGRFLIKKEIRKNTIYAITNWRVIIINKIFTIKIESIYLTDLGSIVKSNKTKKLGNIILSKDSNLIDVNKYRRLSDWYLDMRDSYILLPIKIGYEPIAFYDVAGVERVYSILHTARKNFKRKKIRYRK